MPRLQVYLPDDLHREVKRKKLPASELLQEAVRAELWRRKLDANADAYLARAEKNRRAATKDEVTRASEISRRIAARRMKRAG